MEEINQSIVQEKEAVGGSLIKKITQNKRFFFITMSILFFLILLSIIITIINQNTQQQQTTQTISPTISTPTNVIASPEITQPTISQSTEATVIKEEIKPQLDQVIPVSYDITKVKQYDDTWGLIQVYNPETDPANAVVKQENGTWNVVLGPGTSFEPEELQSIGAPQQLINEVNTINF